MSPWFRRRPDLLEKVESEIDAKYPALRLIRSNDLIYIRGRLDIFHEAECVDAYGIEIRLGNDHPKTIPLVYETDGRIPRIIDRHINEDGSACLFVNWERNKFWPEPTSIASFIGGPVNAFFYSQSHFVKFGDWPWGQRSHGLDGIIESFEDEVGFKGHDSIVTMLKMLMSERVGGHRPCPCGSKLILRKCHGSRILMLHKLLGPGEAKTSLTVIRWYEKMALELKRKSLLDRYSGGHEAALRTLRTIRR